MKTFLVRAVLGLAAISGIAKADVIGPINPTSTPWQQVSAYRYQGAGSQRLLIDFPSMNVGYVAFRLPSQCSLHLTPTFIGGMLGNGVGSALVKLQAATDGFTDAIYQLSYRPGARLRRVDAVIYSPYFYGPEYNCVMTTWISTGPLAPVAVQPEPTPVHPTPSEPPTQPLLPPPPPAGGSNGTGNSEVPPMPLP